jgi:hypothetical protein
MYTELTRMRILYGDIICVHFFKTRPGPAGRPGAGTGPGLRKNSQGFGPAKPGRPGGLTRDPADPGKPRQDPTDFFIYIEIKR